MGLVSAVILIILLCGGGAFCKNSGNCLSAFTQRPRRYNRRYESPNVRTELDEIPVTSEHPPASPSESLTMEYQPASSAESMTMDYPPSYSSLTGISQKIYTWQFCPILLGETDWFSSMALSITISITAITWRNQIAYH